MSNILFDKHDSTVLSFTKDVKEGKIGVPDLQRPFVWPDTKVRDLLDSMMKGYPIGCIILWDAPYETSEAGYHGKQIGTTTDKTYAPRSFVIDGQQRLTALVAALYGEKIIDKDGFEREIKISYNPITQEFAVWTPAYERNAEWIAKCSDVFNAVKNGASYAFRREYKARLNGSREQKGKAGLTDAEEEKIENGIDALLKLENYPLSSFEISGHAEEDAVADIFVRLNSGGTKLTEDNFIQTLISVHDPASMKKILKFASDSKQHVANSSFNQLIDLEPAYVIRMTVGYGFRRARLKYAYMLLNGKNLETQQYSQGEMDKNLAIFRNALNDVCNLTNWHQYIDTLQSVGYVSGKLLLSSAAIIYSYVLFLIGKLEYKLDPVTLKSNLGKWFFMCTVTSYFTNSPESTMETMFLDLQRVVNKKDFVAYLDSIVERRLTDDFFNVTLPHSFSASTARSAAWNAYIASQIILETKILFGHKLLESYFTPGTSGNKKAIDKHHIFPKKYLYNIGITEDRWRNRIANFTYLSYDNNIDISDDAPDVYMKKYRDKLGEDEYKKACEAHALPEGFETMKYEDFLPKREHLMAQIVKKAYDVLCSR